MRRRLGLALLIAALAGCAEPGRGTTVDGWLIGPPATCVDRVVTVDNQEVARGRCSDLVAAAADALDARDPGHAPVVSAQLHDREWRPGTVGGLQYVAVYRLADGSTRAIGVGWPGVATSPFTIDYGP